MDEITPATGEDWRELEIEASTHEGHTARAVLELLQRLARVEPAPAPQAPQGVTVEELVDCLPNPWKGDFDSFARYLLDHPRIGPLLRGEGAPAAVPVVLPEEQPYPPLVSGGLPYLNGFDDGWSAARAEVARQQGGQADG
jgi:hypothetical protein